MNISDFTARLDRVRTSGNGFTARCPVHDDRANSLSVAEGDDGRVLVNCHAGCETAAIVRTLGLELRDLFGPNGHDRHRGRGMSIPSRNTATLQQSQRATHDAAPGGCTLASYAEAKRLPLAFLRDSCHLSEIIYQGVPAVRVPYLRRDGSDGATRFRLRLATSEYGDERFVWKKGSKPTLYGLWRLDAAHERGYVVRVEGESDCHTLWHQREPAVGLPGAGNWNENRDAPELDGIPIIYVLVQPDAGGEAVRRWLATSSIRERVRLIVPAGWNDPSELHVTDPARFGERWEAAKAGALAWTDQAAADDVAERHAAWEQCAALASAPRILDRFAASITAGGYAGDTRAVQLVYLILTSRLLDKPASGVIKGPSSAGKSYSIECVLPYFPASAYYTLTAMSERALAYSDEPLAHRILIVYEAAGAAGDTQSYLLRSLLSEGHIRYETVEKTKDGLRPRVIVREGPTGALLTTTAVRLHPENETRLLSIPVADTPEQTRLILLALAAEDAEPTDYSPWQALQTWLAHGEHRVTIPYRNSLVEAVPPVAVRLRRDIGMLLTLIRAHAVLQQASRDRDERGRIVATLDDYTAVRALVADLVAEGVDATVSPAIRETVSAVRDLTPNDGDAISITAVAGRLQLDKSAVSRRVRAATEAGYLVNLEDKKGKPAKLVIGAELPDDVVILPEPDRLKAALEECCSVAVVTQGMDTPLPPAAASRSAAPAGTPDQVLCRICRSPLPTAADRQRGIHRWCHEGHAGVGTHIGTSLG
jgi:hypothetical protein